MAGRLPSVPRSVLARSRRNLDSRLLQLPLELIFIIAKFLNPVDIVLLAQTCHSLHAIFPNHASASGLRYYRRDLYFSFLVVLARDRPEEWACENCVALHPIVKLDTPAAIDHVWSCPISKGIGRRAVCLFAKRLDTRLWCQQIRIEHRHVSLALKYTRLQKRIYASYLEALLAPHHDTNFNQVNGSQLETHYSAYPKIVMGHDGNFRFLLLSTWRYFESHEKLTFDGINGAGIGGQKICPHIGKHTPGSSLHHAVCETLKAGKKKRQELTGACESCTTDFSVQFDHHFLDLHVWQDFGPEGSPSDLAWQTQCSRICLTDVQNSGPTLYHEPGTIRKLYEEQ
ncbi:hypothetical protein EV127DRAFT_395016 [Xylaria flabelliformis]|nr:hypothetical protein EV127DRAFT_395016 [Xylaria flabelliformis]